MLSRWKKTREWSSHPAQPYLHTACQSKHEMDVNVALEASGSCRNSRTKPTLERFGGFKVVRLSISVRILNRRCLVKSRVFHNLWGLRCPNSYWRRIQNIFHMQNYLFPEKFCSKNIFATSKEANPLPMKLHGFGPARFVLLKIEAHVHSCGTVACFLTPPCKQRGSHMVPIIGLQKSETLALVHYFLILASAASRMTELVTHSPIAASIWGGGGKAKRMMDDDVQGGCLMINWETKWCLEKRVNSFIHSAAFIFLKWSTSLWMWIICEVGLSIHEKTVVLEWNLHLLNGAK